MKHSSRRPEQVAEAIRQVIAEALAREVRDPRVALATVTQVRVSGDYSHATILVSVPGDDSEKARALEGFSSAAGFLRTKLARTLTRRTVPELHFEVDRGLENAARIDVLLGRLHPEDPG
ncbi:MAG: 30S ribosome-binding factor RbfA [Gemmatimonadales bacterium]|nr:30S ribosome-binding factor RbfA [Gemmatimonadales bacterium]